MNHRLPQSLLKSAATLCALHLATAAAAETTVYRCTSPQGVRYTQTPCANGKVLALDDSRNAAQQGAAQTAVQRDQALADRLRHERLEDEAALARFGVP